MNKLIKLKQDLQKNKEDISRENAIGIAERMIDYAIGVEKAHQLSDELVYELMMSEKEKLARIHDIVYSLIFTSVNLTDEQKELIAEIRDLASEED